MIYIKDKFITQQIMFELMPKKPLLKLLSLLYYNYVFNTFKSLKAYTTNWSLFLIKLWDNITPTTSNDAYVWTWNSTCQFGDINIGASIYFCLINSQAFWHSYILRKVFCFLVSLVIGAIIVTIFLMKHL